MKKTIDAILFVVAVFALVHCSGDGGGGKGTGHVVTPKPIGTKAPTPVAGDRLLIVLEGTKNSTIQGTLTLTTRSGVALKHDKFATPESLAIAPGFEEELYLISEPLTAAHVDAFGAVKNGDKWSTSMQLFVQNGALKRDAKRAVHAVLALAKQGNGRVDIVPVADLGGALVVEEKAP